MLCQLFNYNYDLRSDLSQDNILKYDFFLFEDCVLVFEIYISNILHSQKKRSKSCHWGCTFSKGTLLYPKGAF